MATNMNIDKYCIVTNDGPFEVILLSCQLSVIQIPKTNIENATWWILREYCQKSREMTGFSYLSIDNDGLSIICSIDSARIFDSLYIPNIIRSSQKWKAFVVNLIGSATESPGMVHYLADSLSQKGLSILHISTYESEVFLVQEEDLNKALSVFRTISSIEESIKSRQNSVNESINENSFKLSENERICKFKNNQEFILQVLPEYVLLARLSDNSNIQEISSTLVSYLIKISFQGNFMLVFTCR